MKKAAYHHGNLRQALLDRATDLLEEHGVRSVTLRAIAARAGVSHAAPYHHFSGKKTELISAVAAEGFRRLTAMARRPAVSNAPTVLQLINLCRGYIEFAQRNPRLFRLMFSDELAGRADNLELITAANNAFNSLVARARDCIDGAGRNESVDPHEVAMAVWSAGHGLANIALYGPLSSIVAASSLEHGGRHLDRVVRLCLSGILDALE